MGNIAEHWLSVATIASAGVAVAGYLGGARGRALRRASELGGAASALEAHYRAMDAIVDDPALPLPALEMLYSFSEGIADRRFCEGLADLLTNGDMATKEPLPPWFDEMEALRKTRPDLAESFFRAIGSGIVAAFLRWPGNAWKIARMAEAIAQGDQREAQLAERLSRAHRDRSKSNVSSGLVPA